MQKFFCLTVPKNFVGEHFGVSEISGSEKFYASERRGGGGIKFLGRKLFVTQYQKISLGNTSVSQKISSSQNFMHKKRISLNSVEKSLSHSADKIRRRTLLCFDRIQVSKSFKQRRGKLHGFVEICFYLTGPKKLRQGTILCFRKFLVGKNILWIRGGVSRFSVEVFVSLYRNISLQNTLVFQKNSFTENFHAWEGGIRFLLNFFVSQCRKISWASLQCFRKFGVSKNFMHNSGITIFRQKFFVSQCRKTS